MNDDEDGEDDYDEEDAQTIREAVDDELANLTQGDGFGVSGTSSEDASANQTSNAPYSMTDHADEID